MLKFPHSFTKMDALADANDVFSELKKGSKNLALVRIKMVWNELLKCR